MEEIILSSFSEGLILGAGSFESSLSQMMKYMALLAWALAFIIIIYAGWQFRNGSPDQAKAALLGAVVIALAAVIVSALFSAGGLPTINIGR